MGRDSRSSERNRGRGRDNRDKSDYEGSSRSKSAYVDDKESHRNKLEKYSNSRSRESNSKRSVRSRSRSRDRQRENTHINDYDGREDRKNVRNRSRSSLADSSRNRRHDRSISPLRERQNGEQRERTTVPLDNEGMENNDNNLPEQEKEGPNFGLSGLLVAETNTFNGVVIKYNEPPEAIKPKTKWRWYVFKNDEKIDMLHLYRQSAYLIGKERRVADIPMDHVSISSQHAVLQYRKVQQTNSDGSIASVVKPYIIDLESTNGTFVNDVKIPQSRYVELKAKDVLKFGCSSREYVFLKED